MPRILSRLALYLVLTFAVDIATLSHAETYYADPGASTCLCNDSSAFCGSTSTCGSASLPYRCLADAAKRACAGDIAVAKDGIYKECLFINSLYSNNIEIKAETTGHATIERQPTCTTDAVTITLSNVILRGFKITKTADSPIGDGVMLTAGTNNQVIQCEIYGDNTGVYINSADNTLTDNIIHAIWSYGVYIASGANNNVISGGQIFDTANGIYIQNACPQPSGNTFTGIDSHDTAASIVLGGGVNTTIDRCHCHHNIYNGVLEGYDAVNTRIQYSEFDHNIAGLYLKGKRNDIPSPLGTISGNSVHHNTSWGIHLWSAPQGTSTQHYVVENNDVYANWGGIVLGGEYIPPPPTDTSCPPPAGTSCRNVPQYTEVRHNLVHHNIGYGMWYGLGACGPTGECLGNDIGNAFHHNTVYANQDVQVLASFAKDDRISMRNNIVIASPTTSLVQVDNSNIDANFLDGNAYYRPGSGSGDNLFTWNSLSYSFDQIHASGVPRNPAGTCVDAGDPATIPMDSQSIWSGLVSMVDATPKSWGAPYKSLCPSGGGLCVHDRQGDYHLIVGSDGITGGVCCGGSNGGPDIDDEAPASTCAPADCVSPGDGLGADFYLDSDSDGVADLFDCQPFNASNAGICDLDPFEPSTLESQCSANPAAGYDPLVYPTALEICDGKDNDCAGGSEVDADLDGFFPGCSGTPRYDCNDGDSKVYKGAIEATTLPATCFDGVDNDCDGVVDLDCAFNVFPGSQLVVTGSQTCGNVDSIAASSGNNTYECLQEAAPSPYKLKAVWTFSTSEIGTGVNYDLRVEGYRNSGANDNFNFSVSKKLPESINTCNASDGGTTTILTISGTSDTNQLKTADLGLSSAAYCIKAVGSKESGDTIQDLLTLDRLFVFPSPVAISDYAFDPPETGTIILGDYRHTQRSDDPFRETIREELSGGAYRLSHTWQVNAVPAGSGHKLHFEGYRALNSGSKVDDFQFYYSTNPTTGYTLIGGATISTGTDPSGGMTSSSFGGSSLSGTVYIRVVDAQKAGTNGSQSIVSIDHLAITTVP